MSRTRNPGSSRRQPPAPEPSDPPAADGRHRRSQRSRERILGAVAEALRDPYLELTAERVAAEAGVSLSTLFRHFGDMEGLSRALAERVRARVLEIMGAGPFAGDLKQRVRELVRRRAEAFEIMAPLVRANLRQARPARGVRRSQAELSRGLRAQLTAALSPELGAGDDRTEALDALLSTDVWLRLRDVQGLSQARARQLLESAVLTVVAGWQPAD